MDLHNHKAKSQEPAIQEEVCAQIFYLPKKKLMILPKHSPHVLALFGTVPKSKGQYSDCPCHTCSKGLHQSPWQKNMLHTNSCMPADTVSTQFLESASAAAAHPDSSCMNVKIPHSPVTACTGLSDGWDSRCSKGSKHLYKQPKGCMGSLHWYAVCQVEVQQHKVPNTTAPA